MSDKRGSRVRRTTGKGHNRMQVANMSGHQEKTCGWRILWMTHSLESRVDDIHAAVLGQNVFHDGIPNEDDNLEVNVDDMDEMIQDSTQPV
jgi:hypothetical protein